MEPQKKRKYKLYVYVTKDEYELPIAVAETVKELAIELGMSAGSIYSMISRDYGRVKVVEYDD